MRDREHHHRRIEGQRVERLAGESGGTILVSTRDDGDARGESAGDLAEPLGSGLAHLLTDAECEVRGNRLGPPRTLCTLSGY